MHFLKICLAILFGTVFAASSDLGLGDTYCDGTGWVAYKDEKCFKLIQKWSTRDEAKNICAQELLKTDSSTPQLVSIKSAEEQDYLTEFVFETSAVEVNIWIGAKRLPEFPNKFVWDDGSELEFENWIEDSPTEDINVGCVVMQSKYMRTLFNASQAGKIRRINGKWRDVTCRSANYVVCEKLQRWSFGKLQKTLLVQRKELTDSHSELSNAEKRLSVVENNFEVLRDNPIPIGFIYVQLPHQPDPKTLWSTVEWKDVTSDYAGLFFRAEGRGSAEFGTEQAENAPRITQARNQGHIPGSVGDWKWDLITFNVGGWSSGIGLLAGTYDGLKALTHDFYTSGGEVRPRNAAIRIWKRIQ